MELATAFCQNSQNILKKLFACLPDQFDNQSLWCVIADSKALLFHNTFSALEVLSSIVADNIILVLCYFSETRAQLFKTNNVIS